MSCSTASCSACVPRASAVACLRSPRGGFRARGDAPSVRLATTRAWQASVGPQGQAGLLGRGHWNEFVVCKGIQESDANQAEAAYPRQRKHPGAVHMRPVVTGNGGTFERRSAVMRRLASHQHECFTDSRLKPKRSAEERENQGRSRSLRGPQSLFRVGTRPVRGR